MNCVAPGLLETPLTGKITSNEAVLKASLAMHALGRVGKPEHIVSAISWLLIPKMTGSPDKSWASMADWEAFVRPADSLGCLNGS